VRYGLSLLLLEVYCAPGIDSICRQVQRQLIEFIPLSFWYDTPLISRYSDRRHHLWPVYGSLTYGPAPRSSWI
jgi:hypothetical protein